MWTQNILYIKENLWKTLKINQNSVLFNEKYAKTLNIVVSLRKSMQKP